MRAIFTLLLLGSAGLFASEPSVLKDNFFTRPYSLHMAAVSGQVQPAPQEESGTVVMQQPQNFKKSKGKAFLLSLALPGMGERYAGRTTRGNSFIATEVLLWLSYAGFVTYADWRKEDYRTYAATYAQVDVTGKSDTYFIDVGNYRSIHTYNAAKLRQRNLPKYYRDVEKYFWQWDTESHRKKFDDLRVSADKANSRSLFVVGAVFANHLISAIDAVVMAHHANKPAKQAFLWDVRFGDGEMEPLVQVGVRGEF
jgi:hypothetical protein